MSKISLIALDLDGTLLNSEKKISPRNRAALAAAQAQGVKVVLTTGRPLKAMDFLLEELGTAGLKEEYTITFNGGLVQRNNGEILSKVVLAPEDVATIHDETARLGLPLDAISEGTVYEIHADRKSLYSLYNPYLNFIETDFKDLPSTISYNKCVTAVVGSSLTTSSISLLSVTSSVDGSTFSVSSFFPNNRSNNPIYSLSFST